MPKTAILIDGGFYRKQTRKMWGSLSASDFAKKMMEYCNLHLADEDAGRKRELYRIFYYDCPPSGLTVYNPITKQDEDLSQTAVFKWTSSFYEELKKQRKVALRMGKLSPVSTAYMFKPYVLKEICEGKKDLSTLTMSDVFLNLDQKGVDMRIGLDMASMAYKNQVNQVILISGDSDFVPAAKLARREGVDVILDSMGKSISSDLREHIDGHMSHWREVK